MKKMKEFDNLDGDLTDSYNSEVEVLMKNIKDTNDLYFVALIILNKFKESDKHSTLSELCYLLDTQSFMNLLYYFEGMTITIPTREELKDSLQMMSIYYYLEIKKLSWGDIMGELGLLNTKWTIIEYQRKYHKFKKELSDVRFPSLLRQVQMDDKLKMESDEE